MTVESDTPPTLLSELRLQALDEIVSAARLWVEEQAPREVELRSYPKTVAGFCRNMGFAAFISSNSRALTEFLNRINDTFIVKARTVIVFDFGSEHAIEQKTLGISFSRYAGATSFPYNVEGIPGVVTDLLKSRTDRSGDSVKLLKKMVKAIASLTPLDILTGLMTKLSANND